MFGLSRDGRQFSIPQLMNLPLSLLRGFRGAARTTPTYGTDPGHLFARPHADAFALLNGHDKETFRQSAGGAALGDTFGATHGAQANFLLGAGSMIGKAPSFVNDISGPTVDQSALAVRAAPTQVVGGSPAFATSPASPGSAPMPTMAPQAGARRWGRQR